jgi:hypothetical protein
LCAQHHGTFSTVKIKKIHEKAFVPFVMDLWEYLQLSNHVSLMKASHVGNEMKKRKMGKKFRQLLKVAAII